MNNRLAISLIAASLLDVGRGLRTIHHRRGRRDRRAGGRTGRRSDRRSRRRHRRCGRWPRPRNPECGDHFGSGRRAPSWCVNASSSASRCRSRRTANGAEPCRVSLCGRQRSPRDRGAAHPQGGQDHRLDDDERSSMNPRGPVARGDFTRLARVRLIAQSSAAATASPTHAASASTTKSISRACRPGAQNCRISMHAGHRDGDERDPAGVAYRRGQRRARRGRRPAHARRSGRERHAADSRGGPSVAKATAAASSQADNRRTIVIATG